LRENAGNSADRHRDPDELLVPAVTGQVDRENQPDAGLHVRKEEVQPVETA